MPHRRQNTCNPAILISTSLCILLYIGCTPSPLNKCVNNVQVEPSLSSRVCDTGIASTPGTQKLLPKNSTCTAQNRGYAEYVPPDYASSCNYPLIIYMHGDGSLADGSSTAVLSSLNYDGLAGQIYQDNWDTQHRFVVLSPQFSSYGDRTGANVNDFIQFAKANYKIDAKRIYLTSASGGGVALSSYLNTYKGGEAAAALPVCCYITTSCSWTKTPLYYMCGATDSTVQPINVINGYNKLMACNPKPVTPPQVTLYSQVGHEYNACGKSYSPDSMNNTFETSYNGVALVPYQNIYDWMLQYSL